MPSAFLPASITESISSVATSVLGRLASVHYEPVKAIVEICPSRADRWVRGMVQEPRRLHQLPPFDPETVKIVRASCAQLPSDQTELAREFYRQLFEMVPEARAMFPEDMSLQNERLLGAILSTVRHLDQPQFVEAHLRRWGAEHRRSHQVSNDLYIYVAHALVRALARIIGYLETSVASAWMAVYEWMAAVMIDGADADEAQQIGRQLSDPAAGTPFSARHNLPEVMAGGPAPTRAISQVPQGAQAPPVPRIPRVPQRHAHGVA
jgi:hemoglobin-like flavoprotein